MRNIKNKVQIDWILQRVVLFMLKMLIIRDFGVFTESIGGSENPPKERLRSKTYFL